MCRRLLVVVAAFALHASVAQAATYYVSPSGSDSNPGTLSAPWKTVGRVNNASLAPGDSVLFQGGQTFTGSTLSPSSAGAAGSPITFGSYGSARATISNGNGAVWIQGKSYLTFDNLRLTTENANGVIFAGAGSANSNYITLRNSLLENAGYAGINIPNSTDHNWLIENNTIRHVGDSGIILLGSDVTISGNTITDTGWNTSLNYGKHGIYDKGPNTTIAYNDFSYQQKGQAISLRYHGARVYGNTTHDTAYPLAFFASDTGTGVSYVFNNRFWGVTGWSFYYGGDVISSASSRIDLVLANNTIQLSNASEAVNVSEVASAHITLANNVFAGSYGSAYRGCGSCTEYNNDWFGGSSNVPSGSGDLHVDPALSAPSALAPSASSPVVDRGSTSVSGLSYAAACDGQPLHYCGSAPDLGASEYLSAPQADTVAPSAPAGLAVTGADQSSISFAWNPATDNVGVAGYDVFVNGTKVGTTAGPSARVAGLVCDTSYNLGVKSFDAAGNRSGLATITGRTAACPADTVAPSAPAGIAVTSADQTSISFAWNPATDNVGVAGYDVFVNDAKIATTAGLSATAGGLVCGTSYNLGVQAFDAAGNRSAIVTLSGRTASCPLAPIVVDRTPPTVTISSPLANTSVGRSFIVRASAVDSGGVAQVKFILDGVVVCSVRAASGTCAMTAKMGWHTVTVQAVDNAGNVGTASVRFKVSRWGVSFASAPLRGHALRMLAGLRLRLR
jgi:chitodextrinase